jgi:hypothetical protein
LDIIDHNKKNENNSWQATNNGASIGNNYMALQRDTPGMVVPHQKNWSFMQYNQDQCLLIQA